MRKNVKNITLNELCGKKVIDEKATNEKTEAKENSDHEEDNDWAEREAHSIIAMSIKSR
ncbi:MAG: hypothetical protein WC795_01015 [Candidatus Paceibacterota bacterium]|jgi:hypothetical protein